MQRVSTVTSPATASIWIAAKAAELGFDLCGVLPAQELAAPEHFADWLERGFAGEMRYLHDPRRAEPTALMPEARSVIVCAVNYNPAAPYSTEAAAGASQDPRPRGWISRYAWGEDYHLAVGERLDQLVTALREHYGPPSEAGPGESFTARAYVDTGPVSERMAAKLAGLGWLGKNTCLINRDLGSWLFLGVILTSLDLAVPAGPFHALAPDLCGNCRLCLDACPTGALVEPYVLDARRCISYLTIELRGAIPEEFRAAMGWQVFGCDICQDVCPWNRSAPATSLPALAPRAEKCEAYPTDNPAVPFSRGRSFSSDNQPRPIHEALAPEENIASQPIRLKAPELLWLLSLSEQEFREAFRKSAVRRAKWRGLVRNACVAAGNAMRQSQLDTAERSRLRIKLKQWAAADDAIIAEHAQWALSQENQDDQEDIAAPQPPLAQMPRP